MENIKKLISELYIKENSDIIVKKINKLIKKYKSLLKDNKPIPDLSEQSVALICYADNIYSSDEKSLKIMKHFFINNLQESVSHIHFLPFYPFTSDDGFAVQDFFKVKEEYGDWRDIEEIGDRYNLVFDAVVNHISSQHQWFLEYLTGNPKYKDYFIEMEENADVSSVMRARDLPLLSRYNKKGKDVYLWTTFSGDQLDLNYKNVTVLLEMLEIVLFYISKGATIIRLDAIAYIWKRMNSSCINLPETHKIIRLTRQVIDKVKNGVLLLPEANVPSKENLDYFGDGDNEAQLIYQFSISPLVLFTFYTGNADRILTYLENLPVLSENNHFFNILATHDGIGLRPVRDILKSDEIDLIIGEIKKRDGIISYKNEKDGSKTPYELNITYFDALRDAKSTVDQNIDKFIAAHAILLSIQGFPALYFHSLFGTRNDDDVYNATRQPRRLNRKKFEYNELRKLLENCSTHEARVFSKMKHLLKIRQTQTVFHPNSTQKVLRISRSIFSIIRGESDYILVLINITDRKQSITLPTEYAQSKFVNIIDNSILIYKLEIRPFEVLWLKAV